MKLIRIASALLCMLFIFACGGGVEVNDPATVAIWGDHPQASGGTAVAAYLQALTNAFQQANPDKKIGWVTQKESGIALLDKVKAAIEENKAPDVVQAPGGSLMRPFAETETILDMTAELGDIKSCPAVRGVMRASDKIYGVAPFYSVAGLFVNETKFKELGLKIPTTIAELEAAAAALKAKGVVPFAVDATDKRSVSYLYMYLVNRLGGDAFRQSLNRKLRFDSPVYVQAAGMLHDWAKKGYFGPVPLTGNATEIMSGGQAGMQVSGTWMCALYGDPNKTSVSIGFYPFPVKIGGKGAATDILGAPEVSFVAINKPQNKRELVSAFMHAAMSPGAIAGGSGMVCSDPAFAPADRLLGMAAKELYRATGFQFYWEKELPATTAAAVADTALSFLLPDTDVQAACTKFEQTSQSEMGGVIDM
jgi:raffinose/stachyose/melibiose transport system substrate-binding protein